MLNQSIAALAASSFANAASSAQKESMFAIVSDMAMFSWAGNAQQFIDEWQNQAPKLSVAELKQTIRTMMAASFWQYSPIIEEMEKAVDAYEQDKKTNEQEAQSLQEQSNQLRENIRKKGQEILSKADAIVQEAEQNFQKAAEENRRMLGSGLRPQRVGGAPDPTIS